MTKMPRVDGAPRPGGFGKLGCPGMGSRCSGLQVSSCPLAELGILFGKVCVGRGVHGKDQMIYKGRTLGSRPQGMRGLGWGYKGAGQGLLLTWSASSFLD